MYDKKNWAVVCGLLLAFLLVDFSSVYASPYESPELEGEGDIYKTEIIKELKVYDLVGDVIGSLYPGTLIYAYKGINEHLYFQWGNNYSYINPQDKLLEDSLILTETTSKDYSIENIDGITYLASENLIFYSSEELKIPFGQIAKGQLLNVISESHSALKIRLGSEHYYIDKSDRAIIELYEPGNNEDQSDSSNLVESENILYGENKLYKTEVLNNLNILDSNNNIIGTLYPGSIVYAQKDGDGNLIFQWGNEFAQIMTFDEASNGEGKGISLIEETIIGNETKDNENLDVFQSSNVVEFYQNKELKNPLGKIEPGQDIKIFSKNNNVLEILIGDQHFYISIEDSLKIEQEKSPAEVTVNEDEQEKETINKRTLGSNTMSTRQNSVLSSVYSFTSSDHYFEAMENNVTVYDNSTGELIPIGKLEKGEVYKRTADWGSWHQIEVWGQKAYVWKAATRPASKNAESNWSNVTSPRGAKALDKLTVYDNTTGSLVPFGSINKGTDFNFIKEDGGWLIIEYGNRKGYVYKPSVRKDFQTGDDYFEALENNVAVYDNSTGELIPIGKLEKGEVYKRTADWGSWHQIEVWGQKAYVWKAATRPASKNAESNWSNVTSLRGAKALDKLTVYDNTTESLVPFGSINEGTDFNYIKEEGGWLVIEYGNRKGYVYKPSVRKDFQSSDNYFEVLENNTAVYDNSTGKLIPIGKLEKGEIYKRTADWGSWHQIEVWGQKAYVWEDATLPADKNGVSNWSNLTSSHSAKTLEKLTIYDNTSGSLVPFGQINKNTLFKYVKQEGSWLVIQFGNRKGYVYEPAVNKGINIYHTTYEGTFDELVDAQMIEGRAKSDSAGKIPATREEVEYYANPLNFTDGTPEFFQFLVLSEPVGLNAEEVNKNILYDKGNLKGQAQAFINAANEYGINEAYLIAHALHETGNGSSSLASGIPVDENGNVTRDSQGNIEENSKTAHIVYNMYGYGAYDSCPIDCGAEYAFDKGWFSVTESIIGGVQSVYNYINRGQDTLYKMKWNPVSPGYPQYATHVSWAVSQTYRIHDIYSLIDNYVLEFDVPKFSDQPPSSKDLSMEKLLEVKVDGLRIRKEPNTSSNILGSVNTGRILTAVLDEKNEIIRKNEWYQIDFNGEKAWVSGGTNGTEYINIVK